MLLTQRRSTPTEYSMLTPHTALHRIWAASFQLCTVLWPVLLFSAAAVYAQDYPSKPIRFLLPFAPGGAGDVLARLTGQRLQETWNAQSFVEPRPGAGGIVATEVAAKSPPDGYTFIIVTVGHAVNPSLYSKLPYDTLRDLVPVALVANIPSVVVVHPSVPAKTTKELIAVAKASPTRLNYGSGGNATTAHVATALFASMTGVEMTHIPYKGAPVALLDLIGGRLDLMIDQIPSSMGYIETGRLRALAVTPAKRTVFLPSVPTLAESGVPGYEFTAWWMFAAPAKTPTSIVERFNAELQKASADGGFRERLAKLGADPAAPLSTAQTGEFLRREIDRWAKVVKAANIRAE
jgi:tripartite-type tricarboxylate transporter receptor subunit TctC